MTVREAGRLGGLIGGRKGGLTVKAARGVEFYQEIGRLGGQRVRDLMVDKLRANAPREAIERGVEELGRSLAEHYPRRPDDKNELSDEVSVS